MMNYEKVVVLDENGKALEGVNLMPDPMFGPGSSPSNKRGELLVPRKMAFGLSKEGYKRLWVGYYADQEIFSLEQGSRRGQVHDHE
jgi:hypothetical protein